MLRPKDVAELGDDARPTQSSTAGIGYFADVDRPRHIRIAMAEEECNLVDALSGQ